MKSKIKKASGFMRAYDFVMEMEYGEACRRTAWFYDMRELILFERPAMWLSFHLPRFLVPMYGWDDYYK